MTEATSRYHRLDLFVIWTIVFLLSEWLIATLLGYWQAASPIVLALYARCISATFALVYLVPRLSQRIRHRKWWAPFVVLFLYLGYLVGLQYAGLEQPAFMEELMDVHPALLALSIALLGASLEEYWFRGNLFEVLEQKKLIFMWGRNVWKEGSTIPRLSIV